MIALSSEIGKAIVKVRKAVAENLVAIQMYQVYRTEVYREKMVKAGEKEEKARDKLADAVLEAYRFIPSDTLKDLK